MTSEIPPPRGRFVFILIQICTLALTCSYAGAAERQNEEIELTETTYRVTGVDSGEVAYHQRWKALTAQGRADISRISIPYVTAFDDVDIKYFRTIKKDGSVIDGDLTTAFDTAPSEDPLAPVFDDTRYRTVLAPNLETGDSVEYEAVVHVRRWPKPGDFWFVDYPVVNVPVLSETVALDLPADRKVSLYENGATPGKTEIANGRRIERWTSSNPEPASSRTDGATPRFAVSTLLSWDAFGDWIRSLNEKASEPTNEIAALSAKLTANKSSDEERITALYAYVATKVRYISVSFGIGRLQPHAAPIVLRNAYGDCKDQTALLSALLKAAGFMTHAVLTTPGAGVAVPGVPAPNQFNHEFTAVETKSGLEFLDTSMGPVQAGLLQPEVRGRSAVLIGDKKSTIIDIPLHSPVPQRIATTLKGKVTGAGAFEGFTRLEFEGFAEPALRRVFLDATDAEKVKIVQQLAGPEFGNAHVRQMLSGDPGDLTKPFWVQCELSDNDFFAPAKSSMEVQIEWPTPLAALLEARRPDKPTPVESVAITRRMDLIVDSSLTIVSGMPVQLKSPFGSLNSEFSYLDGHLMLKRSFELNDAIVAPADWSAFVDFLRSSRDASARGFTLDRQSVFQTPGRLSPLTRLTREGGEAFQRHDFEAAKRAYLEAVKIDPQSPTVWNDLGRAYAALREYNEAEQAYKRQIAVHPEDLYAYNNLGLVDLAVHRADEAIALFRKQIAVNPRDRFAHEYLSRSLAARNQWQEARKEAAIAAEIVPEDAGKWVLLGRTQIKTGQAQEALESFDRALAQVHDAMTENNIAYYKADAGIDLDKDWALISGVLDPEARLVCQAETLAKADQCGAELRRLSPILDTAGWVLYRQGKLAEAERYLTSAYAITPTTSYKIHLAILLAKSGRLDESLRYFADAGSRNSVVDSSEARRVLSEGFGGETELDSRLKRIQGQVATSGATLHVIALVDEHGKVLDAHSADPQAPSSLLDDAKSLRLKPIAWHENSFRSIRTIEFRKAGAIWSLDRSYVGQTSDGALFR